jgi:outer membrane protein assembly factor BamB
LDLNETGWHFFLSEITNWWGGGVRVYISFTSSMLVLIGLLIVAFAESTWPNVMSLNRSCSYTLMWMSEVGCLVQDQAPIIGADGTVYVHDTFGVLYALHGSTGQQLWNYRNLTAATAIGSDGTLYFGSLDGLYALNGSTGTLKWNYKNIHPMSSPVIGNHGTVYVGCIDFMVYAFNGVTGELTWAFKTGKAVVSSPVIGMNGTVYVGSMDFTLYALDGMTGSLKWKFTTGGEVVYEPAIGSDGTVYVSSADAVLYALNGSTGSEIWSYQLSIPTTFSPSIAVDGTVYVVTTDSRMYAFDGFTGRMKPGWWCWWCDFSFAVIVDDDFMFFGCDKSLAVFNFSFYDGVVEVSSPTIGADGMMYMVAGSSISAIRSRLIAPIH